MRYIPVWQEVDWEDLTTCLFLQCWLDCRLVAVVAAAYGFPLIAADAIADQKLALHHFSGAHFLVDFLESRKWMVCHVM